MKTISFDDGLKARALFALAADHYKDAAGFEKALSKLLALDDASGYCGHLSDAMTSGDSGFDEALAKEGFVIAPREED